MNSYESLLARIKLVRRKWRSQVWVKGISLFLASAIALILLGVWGADLFGFKPAAVWSMRVVTGATVLFVAWYFLYMPLRAPVSNVQIAQYIEEKYPQLEDRLVAAVEYGNAGAGSSGMIDLLIRDALDKTSRVDFSVFVNRKRMACFGLSGIAAFLGFFGLLNWGPSFLPYGLHRLYLPWTEAAPNSILAVEVTPGDIEVAKGSDQQIQARLVGFDSPDVRLFLMPKSSDLWHPYSMEPEPRGNGFRYLLIDLRESLRYYAEAWGVRSQTFSINVVDTARVDKVELTYNFPAYTGMAPQRVEDEGDISALKGTRIDVKIHLSRPVRSARLLFDDQSALQLSPSGAQDFSGSFTLRRSGSYFVSVTELRGTDRPASSEYLMEALEDAPPKVTITRPMRDVHATRVEEVFAEVKAEDDIGVGRLELRYSVNGAPEKMVDLNRGKAVEPSLTGAHTFFLEELSLEPGDLISYYARGWDNNNVTGPGVSSSDIYFIHVRPFERKYVQNQQGGGQGGGSGGEREEALSSQQKEIISATFRLLRDKDKMDPKEYKDGLKSLALVQSRLQTQTQTMVDRLARRGADKLDDSFRKLSEHLKNAVGEMERASVHLGAQKPNDALTPEQKSLQQLMRAESLFREIQVSFAAGSNGSGGSQANAEDLADLFELEMNKLKNQYETVQRGEQQARDQKIDEALQRLKELAQRQQQLNERNRMLERQGGSTSSSRSNGGESQQQLMEQAEQLQRQLQRLSRERSSPRLSEVSSQLQKAIEEMKRALNDSRRGRSAEADAQGARALQQLTDAARKLAQSRESGLKEGLQQAVAESRKLVEEQQKIQEGLDRLIEEKARAGSQSGIKQREEDIVSRKQTLADRLKNLGGQIDGLSKEARRTQKETSNKLAEASGGIRDKQLPERILSGNDLIRSGYYDYQKQREDFIRSGLEDLSRQLKAAQESLSQPKEGRIEEAADRARQLAEGLESMQQRMSALQRGLQQGRQGPQGQQGQPGEQQGQQAQQGQRGGLKGRGQQGGISPGDRLEQGQRGEVRQNADGGMPDPDAQVRGLSGNSSGPPIGLGGRRDDEARQLRREFEQRMEDAQDLRRMLEGNADQVADVNKIIAALRRAGDYLNYNDPEQLARLKAAIDLTRKIELQLDRDLDRLNQADRYFSIEDNEAPADYRRLVEEYYRSIAKSR